VDDLELKTYWNFVLYFSCAKNLQIRRSTQSIHDLSLNLRTPNPGFNPGFTPFYITNAGGEPRVEPGVWRPAIWALASVENY
jgi:hypothetical protein